MKADFKVEITSFKTIEVLPNSWKNEDYLAIMDLLNYGDTSKILPADLKEMCFMCLADEAPEFSANVVLTYIFEDRLTSGQIDQLSHEMQTENMWEEYAELSMHEEFFNVGQLLYMAYNGKFPKPEAAQFSVKITMTSIANYTVFEKNTEENLIRILVQGMPENTLLKRLFNDELESGDFPEAKNILWQVKKDEADGTAINFTIVSSLYFFHDLKFTNNFEGTLLLEED